MLKKFYLLLFAALILSLRVTVAQQSINFSFHPTNYFTGYDIQSTTVPEEIWQDPNNPAYVHAVMMYSGQAVGFSDRTCTYFLSTDYGNTWAAVTNVPVTGEKSGYPSISGMPDGRQVIADHDNAGSSTPHTKIYIADAPGSQTFESYDTGVVPDSGALWTRFCVVDDYNILIAATLTQALSDSAFTINLNPVTGTFSGWRPYDGRQFECYSLAVSEDGSKTGHLYIGNESNFGDLFYRESTDGGYTWYSSVKVWDWNDVDSLGCLRSLDLIFLNNQPCAVFGVDKMSEGYYYPSFPSKIYFWSPTVNGGTPIPIAESGVNVPYFRQYESTDDLFTTVCRPSIGRSSSGRSLFVAFSSVTGDVDGDTVGFANSYFAGYLTYSTNAGQDWAQPVKFTPESPIKDWRYVSVSPTNNVIGEDCTIQMFIQSDTAAGSNVNTPLGGPPVAVSAQMVGVTAEFQGIITAQQPDNNPIPHEFSLNQNYPNPFNPSTNISYSIPDYGLVTLKVYNLLGEDVATIVNEEKPAGVYEVTWNGSDLPSGIYFYQLKAGSFIDTKKMTLLK